MARTVSLLLALALAPAAHALGIIEPEPKICPCVAKEEIVSPILGLPEIIKLPDGTCGEFQTIPCTGTFTCNDIGWDFAAQGGSCASLSTPDGCTAAGGEYQPPLAGQCCGSCELPSDGVGN